jgi:hypothetical protein
MATLQKLLIVMICDDLNNTDGDSMWDTREWWEKDTKLGIEYLKGKKITWKTEHIHCQTYITSACWRGFNTTSVDIGQFSSPVLLTWNWTQLTPSMMKISCSKGHLHQQALLYSWYLLCLLFYLALFLNLFSISVSPWDDNIASKYTMAAEL